MKTTLFVIFTTAFLAPNALAQTGTYVCNYTTYSDATGNHKVKSSFSLTFIVDKSSNKSYMLGILGTTEVVMIRSIDQIAFIDKTGTGNLMTTSITSNLTSVHSRNTVILGELTPSQYYGKCELL
jgi:hypothetical protein